MQIDQHDACGTPTVLSSTRVLDPIQREVPCGKYSCLTVCASTTWLTTAKMLLGLLASFEFREAFEPRLEAYSAQE